MDGHGAGTSSSAGPRILVARPDHLGDLLLTLPAVALLRRRIPGAHIACLVPPPLLPVVARARDVDEGVPHPFTLEREPAADDRGVVERAAAELRGRFDLALLPRPHDPWSAALVRAAAIPLRVGHTQPGMDRFLTHAFGERLGRHVAREAAVLALRAVALLDGARGSHRGRPGGLIEPLPADETEAAALLNRLGLSASPPVVVHPATGWLLKDWPPDRWSEVVRRLADRLRLPVLVLGRREERDLVEEVAAGSGGAAVPVHGLGLGTLASLHRRSAVVVGTDSGALHLAALVGARVVGLFGPFGPSRVGPLAPVPRWRAVSVPLPCSPCGTLERPPCGARRDPRCLAGIGTAAVVDAVEELMGANRRRPAAGQRTELGEAPSSSTPASRQSAA